MAEDDDLLDIPSFAEYCGGISKWTVNSYLSRGILQRTKIGSRTMIRKSERERIAVDGGKSLARRRKLAHTGGAQVENPTPARRKARGNCEAA